MSAYGWVKFFLRDLFLFLLVTYFLPSLPFLRREQHQLQSHSPTNRTYLMTDNSIQITTNQLNGSMLRSIFLRCDTASSPSAACAFFCNDSIVCLVAKLSFDNKTSLLPRVLWSADRDRPNSKYSISVDFTRGGDVVICDIDGGADIKLDVLWSSLTALMTDNSLQITTNRLNGSMLRSVFLRCDTASAHSAACAFFCNGSNVCLVAVLAFDNKTSLLPRVLWSADRDRPNSKYSFSMDFTGGGDVIVRDIGGGAEDKLNVLGSSATESGDMVTADRKRLTAGLDQDWTPMTNSFLQGTDLTAANIMELIQE